MEILSISISSKPNFFSPFSSTTSLTSLTRKTPYKFRETHLKSFISPPCSTKLPLNNRRNPHIFARFGGPTKRRNSLRKKLKDNGGPQVRQNPQKIIDPVHQFVDNESFDSIISCNDNSLENGSFELGEKSSNLENSGKIGESVLWDKLEGWVEQYKKDNEFWGIGSNPIFTVFQDSSGNVERVLVDEDEIIKRGGFEPLQFRKERVLEEFDEVNWKISYAKSLAKELEGGKNVIARNSSVSKFVVSSEKLGFVSTIRSVFVSGKSLAKVSRVGIAVFCGFVLVWVVKKVCNMGAKKVELTGFEKEMLRRKMKSRMVKEKLQMGSVEVVEEPVEKPTVVTERPRIDKEDVLNMIRGAKGSNDSLVLLAVGKARESGSTDMNAKIKEIQMMARHAREIEKGEESPGEKDGLGEDIPKKMHSEERATIEKPEDLPSVEYLEKEASTVLPFVGKDDAEEFVGNMNFLNMSNMEILGNLEMQSSDTEFTSEKVSEWNGDVESPNTSSERIIVDEKSHINGVVQSHDKSNSSNLNEEIQSYISSSKLDSSKKTTARRKPKIIRSVKEAREYLSKKHEVGDTRTSSSRLGENYRAPESSDVERTVPSEEVSQDDNIEENELLGTDTNEMKVETENEYKQKRLRDHPPCAVNSSVDTAINLGEIMKSNEMYKHSDSHERSDLITGKYDSFDANQQATQLHLTKQSIEKVDKLDETLTPTVLSEISDLDSGRNASQDVSNSTEELCLPRESALRHGNLQDNCIIKVDAINETPKPTAQSEIFVTATVGKNLDGSGSKDNAVLPNEIDDYRENEVENRFLTAETLEDHGKSVDDRARGLITDKENWLEKNFHEVEPIMKKIGSGFRNSYNVAREKTKEDVDTNWDLMKLSSIKDHTELEWMQDDKLREIVFKVRDNELAGRDPFHSMDLEDKVAFFEGLESKVEKENQKLSILHEWLHSNIENIDYGADGISIHDPPEKVIPRWKGPPLDTIPEFLNSSKNQQQVESYLQKANESTKNANLETSPSASTSNSSRKGKNARVSKTVIEASDGSIKPGKKSGKEFWQHTKKWSRGFVESYNAETDPEVKSVMKDMGKDLDRWITEKEIQEAAELMDKLPQQGKEVIDKKLKKLKREMELFGPQAVVSKYREYAEEKEVDYLWWLDLPHLLCIELYTYEGEDQRVGFYSLEMAEDLELEPKPRHVIAFQDPGDCKNFCYIVQAHLEMLGKGKAFVVPQPPKDVFWQAKGNGFGVTVIRKGELKLNIDQPLEEVEELITEIGSKMYHDKIMRERSVDVSSLMKGVFGVSPPSNRRKRKKRAQKRPSKS